MLFLEHKYLNLVSSKLDRFKRKSQKLYNFRCPFCHDSQKNDKKTRGYVFEKTNHLTFFCHNRCGGMRFDTFLKKIDPRLFSEFQIEKLKASGKQLEEFDKDDAPRFDNEEAFTSFLRLKKISSLPRTHPASDYVWGRKIPTPYHAVFRWAPHFLEWTNSLVPGKFDVKALKYDCGRIIIPFVNSYNHFYGYQGRSLEKEGQRYISINLNLAETMLFGMNLIKLDKPIHVFEGPIDSIFVPNSIAIAGVNFSSLTKALPPSNIIMCYDNEPHSKDTRRKILEAIHAGLKVVIWPSNIIQKDVNAMILADYSPEHIQYIIESNTFSGMQASTRLGSWSKVI